MHKLSFKRGGFSLIEIVIAVAIFAFAILVIVGLMGSSLKVTRDSEEKIQAANLAKILTIRYQAMLETKALNDLSTKKVTLDWSKSPFPDAVSSSTLGDYQVPAHGKYVDALGESTGSAVDGVFGIKTIVWKDPTWSPKSGGMLVHCSLILQWPTVAVDSKSVGNTYSTTTSFVINP